jgi:hypothetical protein
VSPVKYELGFYTPEDDILHSHRRENLKSYVASCFRPYYPGTPGLYLSSPFPLLFMKMDSVNPFTALCLQAELVDVGVWITVNLP